MAAEAAEAVAITHAAVTFGRRRAQWGQTALMCAAHKGHTDCVRLLLDAGADTNAKMNVRVSAVTVCGCWAVVLGDWCERKHATRISVFSFYSRLFFDLVFYTF